MYPLCIIPESIVLTWLPAQENYLQHIVVYAFFVVPASAFPQARRPTPSSLRLSDVQRVLLHSTRSRQALELDVSSLATIEKAGSRASP